MLTRDLTRSRNLSQLVLASRSRTGFAAVVILRKQLTLCYFHRCLKAVESHFQYIVLRSVFRFGVLSTPKRFLCARPVDPRAARFRCASTSTAALKQRGIVAD